MVSIYHFGIEQGFFQESSFCNVKDVTNTLSKEELLKQLQEKVVSCKDVTFRFLGISLTAINMLLSLLLLTLLAKIFFSYEKVKR